MRRRFKPGRAGPIQIGMCLVRISLLLLLGLFALPVAESAALTAWPSQPQSLVGPERKARKGLEWWADGPISAEPTGRGEYAFWAPNGGDVAATSGTLADPAAVVFRRAKPIAHPGYPDIGYLSGGQTYDLGRSRRLMFVHAERYPTDDVTVFYGSIGLAYSDNDGRTWRLLGEIFRPELAYEDFRRCRDAVNASFGQFVIARTGGRRYFYSYSIDHTDSCVTDYAVFRAPVGEVVRAARRGTVTTWRKLHDGGFTEPALGGRFTDILPGAQTRSFAVTYNTYLGRYLFIYPHQYPRQPYWEWRAAESVDGIHWSAPAPFGEATFGERYAPSVISPGARPQTSGREFWIYYTASLSSGWDRWPTSTLTRQMVTLSAPLEPPEIRSR